MNTEQSSLALMRHSPGVSTKEGYLQVNIQNLTLSLKFHNILGCESDYRVNHAVTVVGYGTEDGVDYWLVKNSWGSRWGDKGFIKMKRGVNMCGIGNTMVVVDCEKKDGTTDAPPTTTTTAAPNPTGILKFIYKSYKLPILVKF